MDIPNLTENPVTPNQQVKPARIVIVVILAVISGLGYAYKESRVANSISLPTKKNTEIITTQKIENTKEIKVGTVYGSNSKQFIDKAIGTVSKGGISGEGTHTLERAGGISQRAALTSSIIDLDLFVGKKVEVTGQTNTSFKSGWLLDVGMIKVLE